MRIQEFLATSIESKLKQLFELARKVPEDRVDWSPGGTARSALDQLQEVAIIHRFHTKILLDKKVGEITPETFEKYNTDRRKLMTIDQCEESALRLTAELVAVIRGYSDEGLELRITLPFGGGVDLSVAELMMMPYWNLGYHEGQIQFILNLLTTD